MYGVPSGQSNYSAPPSGQSTPVPAMPTPSPPAAPTFIPPASLPQPIPLGLSWSEIQTADGRVYYSNSSTGVRQWVKPEELMTEAERAVLQTNWRQYKIWDGRSYYYNDTTKCSVWVVPPEVLLAQNYEGPDLEEIVECESFDRRNKSNADCRREFNALLMDYGITETMTYSDAVVLIKDDIRFHALPTPESKQNFFAVFISNLIKAGVHAERDSRKKLMKDAILDFQKWTGMNQSATFAQMSAQFQETEWYTALGALQVRKLFYLYSIEYIELLKIQNQKLQDAYMQEMKNALLANASIDLTSPNLVDQLVSIYNVASPPAFWTHLSDSQKLVVIKACVNQRIKDIKLALLNNAPLKRRGIRR